MVVRRDFGFTPEALNNNASLLAIDPRDLDTLVLSHGHYDHFGGLVGFLQQNKDILKAGLPFYIGGEECFCSREWVGPPVAGNFGVLDRQALEQASLTLTYADRPSLVGDHAFTTGQIALRSFEKVLSPSTMKIGIKGGIGCYADKLPLEEQTKSSIPDLFRHELATAYNVRGRGLVILTACSHRGVINTIKQAQAASGIAKVYGHRWVPSRPLPRRLRAPDDRSAQGDGRRLRHPAALLWRGVLRTRKS